MSMGQSIELTDKYVIRNAVLRLDDYVFFACVFILLYFIIEGENTGFSVIIFLGLIVYTTFRIFKRLQDRKDKIVIDKNGIKLCDTNELINWQRVNYAYIKQKTEGYGKSARVVDYFHIDTNEGIIRVRMSDFSFNKELLVRAVEYFSGRNIGELTDLLNDKAKKIIGSDRNIDRISIILTDFYKRQNYLGLILLFSLIGISIYLQVTIDFSYVFAIGFTLTLGIMYLVGTLEEKRLKNQEYISELDDVKFKALKKEYGQGYDIEMSKGKKTVMLVFMIVVIITIFIISYLFDNKYI